MSSLFPPPPLLLALVDEATEQHPLSRGPSRGVPLPLPPAQDRTYSCTLMNSCPITSVMIRIALCVLLSFG